MLSVNLILQADMIVVNPSSWSMMPVHDWYDMTYFGDRFYGFPEI